MTVWPLNATQASLLAVLPERVPERVRGRMSGVIGAAGIIGAFAGVALAALSRDVFMGYLLIAGVFLLLTQAFAWTTRDRPPPDIATLNIAQRRTADRVPTFREAPDYWWVFIGRFLLIFGYFSVASFQLFILRDYIGLSDIDEAARVLVAISGMSALLSIAFAVVGGWIADRVGHLRAFVAVSTFVFVPAGLVYLVAPTLTGVWIASGMSAAAFGVYLAVDQALIVRVLPPGDNAGRDLGIMNIANAGPQIIAPSLVGAVVGATGNYQVVFIILIVCTALGAASTAFIKGAR
jgi:MFS family permease